MNCQVAALAAEGAEAPYSKAAAPQEPQPFASKTLILLLV
jgi:hypothetical protein